jgi:outer membrane protein assembly factor BamD (BamD/ComL family)
MLKTILGLIEGLQAVRGPLTFWAFCAVILVVLLHVAITKTKWWELFFASSTSKLTKRDFYRVVRLGLALIFAAAVLLIALTFLGPLILAKLGDTDGLEGVKGEIKEIHGMAEQIVTSRELDQKLDTALEFFEAQDYERGASLLAGLLEVKGPRPPDDGQGYVVATFYGAGQYEKAAREVLERDRGRPLNDYSLWSDMALSIRQYTRKHSLPAGLDLVEQLRKEYGSKLVSTVWCALPVEVILGLSTGEHRPSRLPFGRGGRFGLSQGEHQGVADMEYVLRAHPRDAFAEFGYYYLGQYEQALEANDNVIIRDIILYAAGYEIYRHLLGKYFPGEDIEVNTPEAKRLALDAIGHLTRLVARFPGSKHADDAAVHLGRVYWVLGDVDKAVEWLDRAPKLGNQDYAWEAFIVKKGVFKSLDTEERERRLSTDTAFRTRSYFHYLVAREYHRRHEYAKSHALALDALEGGELEDHESDPNYQALQYLVYAGDKLSSLLGDATMSPQSYKEMANELRREHWDLRASIYVCEAALARFPKSELADNFAFMRILALRHWDSSKLEEAVWEFCRTFPESEFADDALAELVYWKGLETARPAADLLEKRYSDRNAWDNGMHYFALTLRDRDLIDEARRIEALIIERVPESRFARYARES